MRETGGRLNPENPVVHVQQLRGRARQSSSRAEYVVRRAAARVAHGQLQRVHPGRLASGKQLRHEPRSALRLLRRRQGEADDPVEVEIVNFEPATDLRSWISVRFGIRWSRTTRIG